MTLQERARLEMAVRKLADGRPGLRPVVARYLLDLGLAEARRILRPTTCGHASCASPPAFEKAASNVASGVLVVCAKHADESGWEPIRP
jgi:hypothetical protein